jgi:hypothetical protein
MFTYQIVGSKGKAFKMLSHHPLTLAQIAAMVAGARKK